MRCTKTTERIEVLLGVEIIRGPKAHFVIEVPMRTARDAVKISSIVQLLSIQIFQLIRQMAPHLMRPPPNDWPLAYPGLH